ncbi:ATP-dependent DNA helicase [Trichonephila clavipes]|nr:ATP-dependent DNA helicase [Trichonephila clavipes]
MSDGKCTKWYPGIAETITGNNGYPLYRRRSTEDGRKSITLKVLYNTIDVDNSWVKAIKYICKYVNKGSDMAVFGLENTTASNVEVIQYQLGRYISSNEVVWRILSFSIPERYPTIVHLAVHLKMDSVCILHQKIWYCSNSFGRWSKRVAAISATCISSALKLPLNMQVIETPTCNISKCSGMGKVLRSCQLIIWDECTMTHKKSLEALNRTLKDLRGNEQIFGGVLILLAGDFRQTLPVIPRSTPADELNACLKSSVLWRYVEKISLKTNMRVQLQQDKSSERFAKQLLDIGNAAGLSKSGDFINEVLDNAASVMNLTEEELQATVRFGSVPPQFRGRTLWGGQSPPTSLPLPPASREDLRLDGYLEYPPCREGSIHLQTSMSSPGFEPSPYGAAVSVANH